jgi:hypothetical protein
VAVDRHDAEEPSRQPAGGTLIGFHCPRCGRVLPATKGQPNAAPTCVGSKTRTGGPRVPAAGIINAGSGADNRTVRTAARTAYGLGNVTDQRRWVRCACTRQLRRVTVC